MAVVNSMDGSMAHLGGTFLLGGISRGQLLLGTSEGALEGGGICAFGIGGILGDRLEGGFELGNLTGEARRLREGH